MIQTGKFLPLTYHYKSRNLKHKFQDGLKPKFPKGKTQNNSTDSSTHDLPTVFHWSP